MPPESKFTQTVYLCGIPDANTAIPEESAWVRSYDASELGWKECLNGPSHLSHRRSHTHWPIKSKEPSAVSSSQNQAFCFAQTIHAPLVGGQQ